MTAAELSQALDELERLAGWRGREVSDQFCDALDPLFPDLIRRARLTLAAEAAEDAVEAALTAWYADSLGWELAACGDRITEDVRADMRDALTAAKLKADEAWGDGRRAGLEEAAKVADEVVEENRCCGQVYNDYGDAAVRIAGTIRALAVPQKEKMS